MSKQLSTLAWLHDQEVTIKKQTSQNCSAQTVCVMSEVRIDTPRQSRDRANT